MQLREHDKPSKAIVTIGRAPTSIEDVVAVARGAELSLDQTSVDGMDLVRRHLLEDIGSRRPIYGLTTGVGDLYSVSLEPEDISRAQLNMLRSHASGMGAPLDALAVRAIMVTMIKALLQGHSGVSPALVQTMTEMLNRGVVPWSPAKGSVGYLIATSHIGLVVFGEGRAWYQGELLAGREAMERAGIEVVSPGPREGHALISGTYEITGIGALAVHEAARLVDVADVAGAMSLEALRGNTRGYDERLQLMRPHRGQVETARRLRSLLADSTILEAYRDHRLQDALSLRCIPQVHGGVRDALAYCRDVLTIEINSVTDNPVFVVEDDKLVTLPGGNGHGAPTALALDVLAIAIAHVTTMSQARSDRITNGHISELPAFLVDASGANSGFMIPPYAAAAIAGDNRSLAAPASVHTVATCASQEDHVSMGTSAAIKARIAADNLADVLAIELICAAQGLDFHRPLRPGKGTGAAYDAIRKTVACRESDNAMYPDLHDVRSLIDDGTLSNAIDRAIAGNE
ncbi:histidine ammonia-lyase [Rhizobium sp. PP-F2F-G20b]|nr:histidine ammonia-lyase [Rhizobium sp. PP-F2F-G20b]